MTPLEGLKQYGSFGGMIAAAVLSDSTLTNRICEDVFAPWSFRYHIPALMLIFAVGFFSSKRFWQKRGSGGNLPKPDA